MKKVKEIFFKTNLEGEIYFGKHLKENKKKN
jgi:hypothetical protein